MKIDFEGDRLYVRLGSTDLRKGVAGLLAIIENEMHLDALSNSVFFFCNKSHKLLNIIFWNKTGFWLAHIFISKYMKHTPFYYLEDTYNWQGICISRQNMCNWSLKSS